MRDRKELRKYVEYPCVDLGIGDGYFWDGKIENVVGVDLEPRFNNVIKWDITKGLPFREKQFKTCVITEVFEHIPPEKRDYLIEEIKRISSIVIITVPDKEDSRNFPKDNPDHPHNKNPDWLFTKEEFINMINKFGGKYNCFDIENLFYKGYGAVIWLE
ncbi:MAG: class I SAM-dependent methyltransferase [Nitrososphaeria archaeon]